MCVYAMHNAAVVQCHVYVEIDGPQQNVTFLHRETGPPWGRPRGAWPTGGRVLAMFRPRVSRVGFRGRLSHDAVMTCR